MYVSRCRAVPAVGLRCDEWPTGIRYPNMDKVIEYLNANSTATGVTIKYATLSEYFEAVRHTGSLWSTYKDDFFPYDDAADQYWTGAVAARPPACEHRPQRDESYHVGNHDDRVLCFPKRVQGCSPALVCVATCNGAALRAGLGGWGALPIYPLSEARAG